MMSEQNYLRSSAVSKKEFDNVFKKMGKFHLDFSRIITLIFMIEKNRKWQSSVLNGPFLESKIFLNPKSKTLSLAAAHIIENE